MKKVISLGVASALSTFLLVGCGGVSPSVQSHSKHMTQEKVHSIIKKAGKEAGWKMTEFKNNAIIAEKIDGSDSKAVTITFDKHSFNISPSDSNLEDAIQSALNH